MKIIWFVNAAILLAFVKVFEIPSMIPILVDEIHISYAQAGVFMTVYAIARCCTSFPAGSISDRWGAVPVISLCLFTIAVCGILGSVGDSYPMMLAFRVLVSVSVAMIFIAAVDAIPKYMPAEQVGSGIGYINASLNVGIALTLFMTPILADMLGWRWTARLYSVSFFVLLLISIPLLRSHPKPTQISADRTGERAITFAELMANPSVVLLALGAGVLFIELYGVLTWVPGFLGSAYQYSPAEIGTSAMMFGMAAIPASIVTGKMCTNLNRIVWLCVTGGLLAGVGILLLLTTAHFPLAVTVAIISVITWGHSQVIVTIMCLGSLVVPPHSSGKALGLIFTFAYAGSIVPTYLGGYLLTKTGGHTLSFIIFATAAFVSIVVMLGVSRRIRDETPAHFVLKLDST